MKCAIIGNGPYEQLLDLRKLDVDIDIWIGADRGALYLAESNIPIDYAVGDFDSINEVEKNKIKENTKVFEEHPPEKDETDLELAIQKAYESEVSTIYLLGVTGGRLDHELANIQLLYLIRKRGINAILMDSMNQMELTFPGEHRVLKDESYPYISFIPFSEKVEGITLTNFYYPLTDKTISWGSTQCISNKLISNYGTFFYRKGILLVVKSRSVIPG
ncbi:thiamine diphosphokinase [Oceanobacillus halophilus]|uniref:Thiamine diphosphokinase n=1 Tax=Oceanobacillus halophilus TaxID=930130 RepID=A0A495ABQ4_9BACI|nr:thiamine diphosphokinase [Oceanobacillus halophilus]RKQ37439.1 thiamine diphosphokinase [Oceanobacillus halophilus]